PVELAEVFVAEAAGDGLGGLQHVGKSDALGCVGFCGGHVVAEPSRCDQWVLDSFLPAPKAPARARRAISSAPRPSMLASTSSRCSPSCGTLAMPGRLSKRAGSAGRAMVPPMPSSTVARAPRFFM